MAQTPKFDLEEVKKLVDDCEFTVPDKSINAVIAVFKDILGCPKSNVEAEVFIKNELVKLERKNFAQRSMVFGSVVADVYGKVIDGEPWYIKFLIESDDEDIWLEELSFHPPDKPLMLQNGDKINKGGLYYDTAKKVWKLWE